MATSELFGTAVREHLDDELATLTAHLNAATARWLELVLASEREGLAGADEFARWLAFRCGISGREAHEVVRVAGALQELPAIRAAFSRGELTFTKVRALTRVATAASEQPYSTSRSRSPRISSNAPCARSAG